MRVNLKILLLVICSGVLASVLLLQSRCGDSHPFHHSHLPARNRDQFQSLQDAPDQDDSYLGEVDHSVRQVRLSGVQEYEEIDCNINGEYSVSCRKEGGEIYVPFSFLHKYFEVYGKLASYDGYERFEWSHSYSKVYYPKGKYDPHGVFMYFENYNVEVRDRVKCISGTEGVPVSTQWESKGYYYPTQIAQFGLSHYSKNLTEPEPRKKWFEEGEQDGLGKWSVQGQASLASVVDADTKQRVVEFSAPESVMEPGASLKMDHVLDFVLSLDLKAKGNCSFTITLQNREKQEVFHLHYVSSDTLIFADRHNIYHGIGGPKSGWHHLTRDLVVDLQKGLLFQTGNNNQNNNNNNSKRKLSRSKLKVVALTLHGSGQVDNITLSTSEHTQQFFSAADWFVRHQDLKTGGWENPVQRRFAAGMVELKPGWFSAMGQGHAISVLSRAYHLTGKGQYLESAVKALGPFQVESASGGVRAVFGGNIVWYEEYPTTPSSFVLNGFVYSLLGLYDLMTIAGTQEARRLFEEGMASLKKMLPLYDTGAGSVYDLRHFTLGVAPNVARWDYHSTHINQLLLLTTIDKDPILSSTAERWIGYMNGKKAAHN